MGAMSCLLVLALTDMLKAANARSSLQKRSALRTSSLTGLGCPPVGDLLALVGVGWILEHEQAAARILGIKLLLAFLSRGLPDVLLLLHVLQQQWVLHAGCTRIETCSRPQHQLHD